MVSLKALEKRGVTDEALKSAFTSDKPTAKIEAQKNRMRARVTDGLQGNFQTYKTFWAIDEAYNAPFHQATVTILQALARQPFERDGPMSKEVYSAINELGLNLLLTDEIDPKTQKPTGRKRVDLPTFFKVVVPLVPSYVKMRAATITNQRNQTPQFKFEPGVNTPLNRARCELLTSRVESMSTQMGMKDVERQCILKALMYATQLQFVHEEWYEEEQEDDTGKTITVKEGLRYHLPHPTRTFWDIAYPLMSLHSDIGCKFAGYWRVQRYRDVLAAEGWWNVDQMRLPATDYRRENVAFFNSVYSTCSISFPRASSRWNDLGMDREDKLQNGFYTSDWEDSGVVITEYFEKLKPKDDLGIGEYNHPVWFRFVVANSDTVLYANPMPGCPVIYWGYDPDENRAQNPSLALEVLPSQDHASNLLTQMILSVKQNLANLVFVDEDMVSEDTIKQIENTGEGWFRHLNIVRFLGRKFKRAEQEVKNAVATVRFPQLDTNGTLVALRTVLDILDRLLGVSAQERGGQASHEQSREEIVRLHGSTQTRLEYTSSNFDRSVDAWKQQIYSYLMAYGEDEIYAQITPNPAYTTELLNEIEVEVIEPATEESDMKMRVKGTKRLLQLEYFASTRDGQDRTNNAALANAMTQFLASALANQMMQQAIGPVQAIALMNQALEQFGFPKDFKLRAMPQASETEQQQWVMQQLQALGEQVKQFVQQGLTQSSQAVLQEVAKALQPIQQATQQIGEALAPLQQGIQEAQAQGAKNEMAIAKIAEVLEAHQELNDVNDQQNPLNTLGTPAGAEMVVAGGS